MRIANKVLSIIEEDLPALLLGIITTLILADVIGRYIFNAPVRAASEISFILITWVVFLATAALVRRGMHIAIDSLYEILPAAFKFVLDLFGELLLIAVLGFVSYHTIVFVQTGHFITLPATGVSKKVTTLAIAVGLTLSVIHSAVRMVRSILQFKRASASYAYLSDPFEVEAFEDLDTRGVQAIQREFEDEVLS